MPGQPIGPYEILGELGRGGMGVVYRARRADLDREFAVKVLAPGGADPESAARRLHREAQAAARLAQHAGVVGIHDLGTTDDGALYVAMDYVPGRSLDLLIAEEPLTVRAAAALGAQVADAIAFAHAQGVLHRDLKPANILIEGTGDHAVARVTDFGLARIQAADAQLTRLTHSGEILGTPAYMAPEQATGSGVDGRADVYALGATLFECVAGHPPFQGGNVLALMTQVLRDPPPRLDQIAPECPPDFARVVSQCLAKPPEARYASAAELADDLRRFQRGEPVRARAARPTGRTRPALLVAALTAVVVAGVAAWWAARGSGDRTAPGPSAASDTKTVLAARQEAERSHQIATAWRQMATQVAPHIQVLIGPAFGAQHTTAELDTAQAAIVGAAARVQQEHPAAASPAAWRRLADALRGATEAETALAEAAVAAPDDPFVAGLHALALVVAYARQCDVDTTMIVGARVVKVPPYESPELGDARDAARSALQALTASPAWADLGEGAELRALAEGAGLLARDQSAEAAAVLAPVVEDPLLGPLAHVLRGLALSDAGADAEAAAEFEALVPRGWSQSASLASLAWMAAAMQATAERKPSDALFERAIRVLDAGQQQGGAPTKFAYARAGVYFAWYRALTGAGQTGAEPLQRAVAEFERTPGAAQTVPAAIQYGRALRDLGELEFRGGGEGRGGLTRAASVFRAASAALGPGDPGGEEGRLKANARESLAQTLASLGAQEAARGGDWRAAFDAAYAELGALEQDVPDRGSVHSVRSHVAFALANTAGIPWPDRDAAFGTAVNSAKRWVEVTGNDWDARGNAGDMLVRWAMQRYQRRQDYAAQAREGVALLESVLAERPQAWRSAAQCALALQLLALQTGADAVEQLTRAMALVQSAQSSVGTVPSLAHQLASVGLDRARAVAQAGGDADAAWAIALTHGAAATRLEPERVDGWRRLARIQAGAGDRAAACESLRTALRLQPDSVEVRQELAAMESGR